MSYNDNTIFEITNVIRMLLQSFKRNAKLMKFSSLACLSLLTTSVLAGPPGSAIKDLRIVAGNGTSATTIYANGNMQAKLNIFYELDSGESVDSIKIKELYTGNELSKWTVSDIKNNNFVNDVQSGMVQSGQLKTYLSKYLTTNSPSLTSVCVELTTINGSVKSTCKGDTNQSSVQIKALQCITYNFTNDWVLSQHAKIRNSFGNNGESWVRAYTPPKGFKIAYIDYRGAFDQTGRVAKNAHLIFSSPTYQAPDWKSQ